MTGRAARAALLGERLARHGLGDRPCSDVRDAVARTTAIQAQDTAASYLGVRARTAAAIRDDVVAAVEVQRSITRTWLMRGTIHLVDSDDLGWLVRLVGPTIQARYRTRWRQIGLTDDVLDACADALPDILAAGPLTRHEIAAALADRGIDVTGAPDTQAPTHAVVHACTTGLVCRGADRGRHSTFVLTEQWLPDAPAGPGGDDALAELARRYFAAYSPATVADFTTWAGFGTGHAVELIRAELSTADVDGRPGFRLGEVEPLRGVRLLPAFDNFVLGFKDRSAIVDDTVYDEIYQGGMIRPVVLVDGRATGTWRLDRAAGRVHVHPFRDLRARERTAVEREIADIGRFLARELDAELHPAP